MFSSDLNKIANILGQLFTSATKLEDVQATSKGMEINFDFGDTSVVSILEMVKDHGPFVGCYQADEACDHFGIVIFNPAGAVALSQLVPILESAGLYVLAEKPVAISFQGDEPARIAHDLEVSAPKGAIVDFEQTRQNLVAAIVGSLSGQLSVDGFNKLLSCGKLSYRQIDLVRTYFKYMKQLGVPYTQQHVERVILEHHEFAYGLIRFFEAKFDPAMQSGDTKAEENKHYNMLMAYASQVDSLDDEKILTIFLNLVSASLRTNFFQKETDGAAKKYISIKFDCAGIDVMPLPRPKFEIFVFSNKVEGVHIRGGKVARGGLRWSDRVDDYRTEILGLVKAQMVKNAVIVPEGAKGGFVIKTSTTSAKERQAAGIEGYRTFISALLDITDNIEKGKTVRPCDVVRHDEDDPYLVVAADKGTATFSDIANEISQTYGFWLDDAFASGGSNGYDHKKMGITAKGAWEAVKRHFREIGIDTQSDEFTVCGVGDMGGDVFGNGMLLSNKIRLIAAFNHKYIFIDPTPDAKSCWAERKRLFEADKSDWSEYDETLLSKGGGIYDRSQKTITVSKEACKALSLETETLSPADLIKAILRASVDLMWFGGIGTYVRATSEDNRTVGDTANDLLRVSADELKCKVIGEGANLALTQQARIEYALAKGRINTDAIDNAAGVNCSDHEVNIKILLQMAVEEGLLSKSERNQLLEEMTPDVERLVLRDNYLQTQAVTVSQTNALDRLDRHKRLMQVLAKGERGVYLDRMIEALPDDEELTRRQAAGQGLVRPEIAVLLSYTKMAVFNELIKTDFPDQLIFERTLQSYFPIALQEGFADLIKKHPLRREIITNKVVNSMVNRVGSGFINDMQDYVGCDDREVATAYALICKVFDLFILWGKVEALDLQVTFEVQQKMLNRISYLVEQGTHYLLRRPNLASDAAFFTWLEGQNIESFLATSVDQLDDAEKALFETEVASYCDAGVPMDLANRVATSRFLLFLFPIAEIARKLERPTGEISEVFYQIGQEFSLTHLAKTATELAVGKGRWERSALHALSADFLSFQSDLSVAVLKDPKRLEENTKRIQDRLLELTAMQSLDLATLSVAAGTFRQMVSLNPKCLSLDT
ncbi:NAD-glutamate dehydrogenase [Terasakiella sp. A23]|uniref:NAD-glutamate dehydrogenase domain-containing protein n=1 Tax=Terasakiella sp. FCG-A23 TaxID=3080561 RepID=UPI00295379D2|nr:NAD-glutamate dehydrogenase domain-containing protein [Terasakiella sp. A23]MDV7341209.1 NAD-glutamate dehydrogenase [Terasakiella sp. A23]